MINYIVWIYSSFVIFTQCFLVPFCIPLKSPNNESSRTVNVRRPLLFQTFDYSSATAEQGFTSSSTTTASSTLLHCEVLHAVVGRNLVVDRVSR